MADSTTAVTRASVATEGITLKCLKCGGKAEVCKDQLKCAQCGSCWPIRNGIPRLFQIDNYYWGEIERQEMRALLADAQRGPWKEAVRTHLVGKSPHLPGYFLDLQRASWLALLGLDETAVALDLGCGYGAITHSLALSLGQVYSIEAIPERIEFTQERLRQEGITNVSLLQASATNLPFFESSFDLIVVNGILEWVGEWDLEGSPRSVQLRFLASLKRLLKPDGVMVIGIENQFGMSALRGAIDHSGMRYTSLVPRRVATWMLRHGKDAHPIYRTRIESKQYRTYTYSAGGYRRLLKEAGFATVRAYWAQEGYNNPFRLIPLDARPLIREQFQFLVGNFGSLGYVPRSLKLKALWRRSRPFGWFVSQFVLVAGKSKLRRTKVDAWFEEAREGVSGPVNFSAAIQPYRAVYTNPYADKLVVKLWDDKAGCIPAVAKINLRKPSKPREDVEAEYTTLVRVKEQLRQFSGGSVQVPRPLGMLKSGSHCYTLESLAPGKRFREIIFREGYAANHERALAGFRRVIKAGAELTRALQGLTGIRAIDPSFYRLPKEIAAENGFADRVRRMRYFSDSGPGAAISWIQHGDFWPGNIYLCERTGKVTVTDWTYIAAGLPPLYDMNTLILGSDLTNPTRPKQWQPAMEVILKAAFSDLYLDREGLGQVAGKLLREACELLELDPSLIPSLIVEFLLLRVHLFEWANHASIARTYIDLLRSYVDSMTQPSVAAVGAGRGSFPVLLPPSLHSPQS